MKRAIAVFLATYLFVGSLIPGNSLFELSSLPSLVKHFQYHRLTETPGISLIAFLKLHYSNVNHQKSDPSNHCNLPLQHKGDVAPMDEIVSTVVNPVDAALFYSTATQQFSLSFYLPGNQFASGIFHPPSVLS